MMWFESGSYYLNYIPLFQNPEKREMKLKMVKETDLNAYFQVVKTYQP